jgi:multidrug efflux pump subunit AcrA (membrane-fusion protein)
MSDRVSRSSHLSTVIWVVILAVVALCVRWVVLANRAPGSMTLLEAQGMDMSTMKAPTGVQPVTFEEVGESTLSGGESFPATIQAFGEEDVVARIPGRVAVIYVYPGDAVTPGRLLARLEANEYGSQAGQAAAIESAALASTVVAEKEVQRLVTTRERMAIEVATMATHLRRTTSARQAAAFDAEQARGELKAKQAEASERRAELTYASQSLERDSRLYKAGAISLDELQQTQAAQAAAQARLSTAEAGIGAALKRVEAADKRTAVAEADISEAVGHHEAARKGVQEADAEIAKARAELIAKRNDALAMRSGSAGARVIAAYREVRALTKSVVSERLVSPGSVVQAGQPLFKLRSVDRVRVQARVPARLASAIRPGSAVRVESEGSSRVGRVSSVFPTVDPESRTFTVEAVLSNADRSLVPGMFAKMSVSTGARKTGLTVPSHAILMDADGGHYVWVVGERAVEGASDWTCSMHPEISRPGPGKCPICEMALIERHQEGKFVALRRRVVPGSSDSDRTQVTIGLKAGDRVIVSGHADLIEGAPIAPEAKHGG